MATKHIFTEEEIENIKKGFYEEKLSLENISKKYGIGKKPLVRFIKENNMTRESIKLRGGNFIDETGNKYGKLTVMSVLDEKDSDNRTLFLCQCECGNLTKVSGKSLRRGHTKSCGCLQKEKRNFIDEAGNVYGRLTVLSALEEKDVDNRNLFLCQCECGNLTKVSGKSLRSGNTKSCGCLQKEKAIETLKTKTRLGNTIGVDLTGQRFGKLTVVKEVESITKSNGKSVRQWLCKCDCGGEIIAQHVYLTTGDVLSCGCLKSLGALSIEKCLKENDVIFEKEYSFSDLGGNLPYRFDFAILDNENLKYLIEFDGEQHYDSSNGFFSKERCLIDMKKNRYCLEHSIPLIRIPYNYKDNIILDFLKPETTQSEFLVSKENHYGLSIVEEEDNE